MQAVEGAFPRWMSGNWPCRGETGRRGFELCPAGHFWAGDRRPGRMHSSLWNGSPLGLRICPRRSRESENFENSNNFLECSNCRVDFPCKIHLFSIYLNKFLHIPKILIFTLFISSLLHFLDFISIICKENHIPPPFIIDIFSIIPENNASSLILKRWSIVLERITHHLYGSEFLLVDGVPLDSLLDERNDEVLCDSHGDGDRGGRRHERVVDRQMKKAGHHEVAVCLKNQVLECLRKSCFLLWRLNPVLI